MTNIQHLVKVSGGKDSTAVHLRAVERNRGWSIPRSIRIGRRALWIQSELQGWVRQLIAQNRPLQVDG
ncbi:hypothetical protein [Stenotrophomonas maltophilia]|uniref:hypothetical protein n=1 Tax=Stenotrophomonas maltophilia TaxID=40324 RepID=UPI0022F3C025|nr:hypothetical protein [Stenotrophomonas maltophilia]MDA5343810.1 hypothetical protein [Stenotrophomonas maltophilia]